MFKWLSNTLHRTKDGVALPETYYIIPVNMKIGDKEIVLKEDGSIDGDFEVFDNWAKSTIVKAFADERAIIWLLREHWKLIRALREVHGLPPDIPKSTAARLEDLPITMPAPFREPQEAEVEIKSVVPVTEPDAEHMSMESYNLEIPPNALTVSPIAPTNGFVLEPEPIEIVAEDVPGPRTETVIIQTENGPKEFIIEFKE